ncbi:hypothetical protein [Corynebacterium lubricantis]|uniref:hypothetical protein n=1 Tax=Corynebacterium lubricantis TaxID=541095 RepID=UPI00037D78F0|nr:hypothetical protein [Corynebacterium lubricantis]
MTRTTGAGGEEFSSLPDGDTLIDDAADVPEQPVSEGLDPAGEDAWLDRIQEKPEKETWRQRIANSFAQPKQWFSRTWAFISTTPGMMVAISILLTLAIFAAGYAMSQSSATRQSSLDTLVTATEPMSNSSHVLYTSLSAADTVATASFVEFGAESPASRREYFAAIDRAIVAANQVLTNSSYSDITETTEIQELVTEIQREIPIYSGMVETARANNRMGNPLGATYMSDASSLMREGMLPKASRLFDITRQQVATEQQRLTFPQLVPLSGLLAAIFFLLLAQWWLAATTHRRLNQGFLAATVFMAAAVLWVSASNYGTWLAGTRGFEDAAQPWDELTTSRIAAQESRTDETLALVRRQSMNESAVSFDNTYAQVSFALDNAATENNQHLINAARTSLEDWSTAHYQLTGAMENGDYEEAVRILTAQSVPAGRDATAAMAFDRLDATLSQLISESRESMREYINEGLAATNLVAASVMILSLLSVLAVWLGIRPRIQEYM